MATKRQQTMAKITRERAVKEKRERKAEKKRAVKAVKAENKARAEAGLTSDRSSAARSRRSKPVEPGRQLRSSMLMSPTEMMVRYWRNAWCPACSRYWSASSIRR